MSYGQGGFGLTAWGGNDDDELSVVTAVALSENRVRIEFNQAPFFSGVLDPHDASSIRRYAVSAVAGTYGLDGKECRPVRPSDATLAFVDNGAGKYIDLTVDRPFSPYPAQYRVSVNNLVSEVGGLNLSVNGSSALFYGLLRGVAEDSPDKAMISPDIASPQTTAALRGIPSEVRLLLGGFALDESHDVATDDGDIQRQKRVIRRIITKRGSFLHLPGYGLGIDDYLKTIDQAAKRSDIIVKATKQLMQEPDFAAVQVSIHNGRTPGSVFMKVLVKPTTGRSFKVQMPLKAS